METPKAPPPHLHGEGVTPSFFRSSHSSGAIGFSSVYQGSPVKAQRRCRATVVRPAVSKQENTPGKGGVAPLVSGSRPRRPSAARPKANGGVVQPW